MISLGIKQIGDNLWEMDKIPIPDIPSVYFIYNDERKIIYVGQTKRLLRRTIDHFRTEKWFKLFAKYISYLECENMHLRKVETYFIEKYRPVFNFEHYNTTSDGDMREVIQKKAII